MTTARQRRLAIQAGKLPSNGKQFVHSNRIQTVRNRRTSIRPEKPKDAKPVSCRYLDKRIGTLVCNCSGKAQIWTCTNADTPEGYAIPINPRDMLEGPIRLLSGEKVDRMFLPWWPHEGNPWRENGIMMCDRCPRRADPVTESEWIEPEGDGLEILNPDSPICVLTAYTPRSPVWNEIGEETSATMREYCQRQGYAFRCHTKGFEPDIHPSWSKIKFLRQALKEHKTVLWMDADALVTNPFQRIEDLHRGPEELCLCHDTGAFNCGMILLRRSSFASWLLSTIWARRHEPHRLWEQDVMRELINLGELGGHLRILPPRTFNSCVPPKGRIEYDWAPGDFVAHIFNTQGFAERKAPHVCTTIAAAKEGIDEAKIQESKDFFASAPAYPSERFAGRGIVTSAGGPTLQLNAYVMIRLLRELGCTLPIECWHDGDRERDGRWQKLVRPLGVTCVDGRARGFDYQRPEANIVHAGKHPCTPGLALGLNLKVYAVTHSAFSEVMWIDADSFPIRDPSFLFDDPGYKQAGHLVCPDPAAGWAPNLAAFGLGGYFRAGLETGQMVFDKTRMWSALLLNVWYNQDAEHWYKHSWTDKDTMLAAILMAGHKVNVMPLCLSGNGVFGQMGPDGEPLFCHRVAGSKLKAGQDPWCPDWFPHKERTVELMAEYEDRMTNQKPVRLHIASRKRSGSGFLAGLIGSSEDGLSLDEPFLKDGRLGHWDATGDVVDWMREACEKSDVAAWVQQSPNGSEHQAAIRDRMHDAFATHVVILYRRDLLAQYASFLLACIADQWKTDIGEPLTVGTVAIGPQEFRRYAESVRRSVDEDIRVWSDRPHLLLAYEDAVADPAATVRKLEEFFGCDLPGAVVRTQKADPRQLEEVVENYDQVAELPERWLTTATPPPH